MPRTFPFSDNHTDRPDVALAQRILEILPGRKRWVMSELLRAISRHSPTGVPPGIDTVHAALDLLAHEGALRRDGARAVIPTAPAAPPLLPTDRVLAQQLQAILSSRPRWRLQDLQAALPNHPPATSVARAIHILTSRGQARYTESRWIVSTEIDNLTTQVYEILGDGKVWRLGPLFSAFGQEYNVEVLNRALEILEREGFVTRPEPGSVRAVHISPQAVLEMLSRPRTVAELAPRGETMQRRVQAILSVLRKGGRVTQLASGQWQRTATVTTAPPDDSTPIFGAEKTTPPITAEPPSSAGSTHLTKTRWIGHLISEAAAPSPQAIAAAMLRVLKPGRLYSAQALAETSDLSRDRFITTGHSLVRDQKMVLVHPLADDADPADIHFILVDRSSPPVSNEADIPEADAWVVTGDAAAHRLQALAVLKNARWAEINDAIPPDTPDFVAGPSKLVEVGLITHSGDPRISWADIDLELTTTGQELVQLLSETHALHTDDDLAQWARQRLRARMAKRKR